MNIWFVLAMVCGIGVPIFGYIGTQQQSDGDSKRLEEQFSQLGDRITDLNQSGEPTESKLIEVKEEYAKLADEFNKSRHQRAAKFLADKSGNTASQLEKTEKSKKRFNQLHQTTLDIVAAYNEQSDVTKITVSQSEFPENLFSKNATDNVYIALSNKNERWVIRPTIHKNEIVYEFGRLKPEIKNYREMADRGSPFDGHTTIYLNTLEGYSLLTFYKDFAQEYAYLLEDAPTPKSIDEINILAEHVVRKIVELMLLPHIE